VNRSVLPTHTPYVHALYSTPWQNCTSSTALSQINCRIGNGVEVGEVWAARYNSRRRQPSGGNFAILSHLYTHGLLYPTLILLSIKRGYVHPYVSIFRDEDTDSRKYIEFFEKNKKKVLQYFYLGAILPIWVLMRDLWS
jgi:hypothetical protein